MKIDFGMVVMEAVVVGLIFGIAGLRENLPKWKKKRASAKAANTVKAAEMSVASEAVGVMEVVLEKGQEVLITKEKWNAANANSLKRIKFEIDINGLTEDQFIALIRKPINEQTASEKEIIASIRDIMSMPDADILNALSAMKQPTEM